MAKPVMIGEIQANGQFTSSTRARPLPPKAWSSLRRSQQGQGRRLVLALGLRRLHLTTLRGELISLGRSSSGGLSGYVDIVDVTGHVF
jgi:hypothetical protein